MAKGRGRGATYLATGARSADIIFGISDIQRQATWESKVRQDVSVASLNPGGVSIELLYGVKGEAEEGTCCRVCFVHQDGGQQLKEGKVIEMFSNLGQ